jgi:hypothetical protein
VFSWARARQEAMGNAVATKIMIAFPVINSLLEKLLGQESVNLNYEHPFSSAVTDASTR